VTINKATAATNQSLNTDQLREITKNPSGKWQVTAYYADQSEYIGAFQSKKQVALVYTSTIEQLQAASCTDEMERCVQDTCISSAASTVAYLAQIRAGISVPETAMASANTKKQRLPSISNTDSVPLPQITTKAKKLR
jgi:hypothetical protein